MKAMLRHVDNHGIKYDCLMFVCPGCAINDGTGLHMLPVNATNTAPSWDWDGNLENPTLNPSILTHTKPYVDGKGSGICHSFLKEGVFQFLGDCTHALVNQDVPLPDLPDWTQEDA